MKPNTPPTRRSATARCSRWLRVSARLLVALSLLGVSAEARGTDDSAPAIVDDFRVLADAITLEAAGKAKEAAASIGRHTFDPANDAAAAVLRGRMIEEAGDDGAAETVYEEALKRHPDDALLHLRAGVLTMAQGDLGKARFSLERSWKLSRTPEAAYYLGVLFFHLSGLRESRDYFVQAVILDGGGTWRDGKQGNWRARATKELAGLAARARTRN